MSDYQKADIEKLSIVYGVIDFAETLPMKVLTSANTTPLITSPINEHLVTYVLHIILTTDWFNDSSEDAVGEIFSILSQLDMSIYTERNWQDLFKANKALGQYLNSLK